MGATKIVEGILWVGAQNPDLRIFDVIMSTRWGTSYNSYLVQGSEKTVLVDTVKEAFVEDLINNISEVVDASAIDYIVCNHTEPDHSGALEKMLELAPNAVVVCSKSASIFLRNILNCDFKCKVVQDGDTIELGGKTLKFISAPFLHWPDSMFTYVVQDAVLLSGDVFGFHFSAENVFDDLTELTNEMVVSQKYYFDVIMGPFKKYVLDAIAKIRDLHIDVIGPSHGPVLRAAPWDAVDRYEAWSKDILEINEIKKVYVGYVSCYGYTKELALTIGEVVRDAGFDVEVEDISTVEPGESAAKIHASDAFAIGSPTLNRDALKPVWDVLTSISTYIVKGKPAAVFGSFGWSGESVKYLTERLRCVGADVVGTCSARLRPDDKELDEAKKVGKQIVDALKG
jgi:flavorubredoxin